MLRKGKVEDVYEVSERELEFRFSDRISVFDKIIPSEIPRKGEVLCRMSAFWFDELKELGIRSHFLQLKGPNRMRVRRVRLPQELGKGPWTNCIIPVEWICRHYVAGSLDRRLRAGEIDPESLGFASSYAPRYGDKLPTPFFEQTTKFERYDRVIDRTEAMRLAGMTEDEYTDLRDTVLMIDDLIEDRVAGANLTHVDGKKEFAFDEDRNLMVVDTFGTPDEDRFWERAALSEGRFIEMSKEKARKFYESIGFLDKLSKARELGAPEPDIPPLPKDEVQSVSQLYAELYERITGDTL